jgi:hypothetical protein
MREPSDRPKEKHVANWHRGGGKTEEATPGEEAEVALELGRLRQWPVGEVAAAVLLLEEEEKGEWVEWAESLGADLNLNQMDFEIQIMFKPSQKIEIWDFCNKRILKLKSKFKSRRF